MKTYCIIALLSIAGLLNYSCKKDKGHGDKNDSKEGIEIIASISGKTPGETTSTWKETHAMGIFMKKSDATLQTGIVNESNNRKYVNKDGGIFIAADKSIHHPNDGSLTDIIAYYPFSENINNFSIPIDISNQQNQEALDLLYSNNATRLSANTKTSLNLDFKHQLSKIVLQINHKINEVQLANWNITLQGIDDKANFDLASGKISNKQKTNEPIPLKLSKNHNMVFAEGTFIPTEDLGNKSFVIEVEGKSYPLSFPSAITALESGKVYIFSLNIAENTSPITFSSHFVRDWQEPPTNDHVKEEVPGGFQLVWEEHFASTALDEKVWNIELVQNPQNNEYQTYVARNISLGKEPETSNSCLIITAKKETVGNRHFTSGRLNTMKKVAFRYGRVDASIKLPKTANGLWPAFWMKGNDNDIVSWPSCGEIDILEMGHVDGINTNNQERNLGSASHWGPNLAGLRSNSVKTTMPYSLQDGNFHLYTLIWDKDYISVYVDLDKHPNQTPHYRFNHGANVNNSSTYFNKEFYLLLNLAVGGNYTGISGINNIDRITSLNEANGYEAKMYVDFVKIYQKGESNERLINP